MINTLKQAVGTITLVANMHVCIPHMGKLSLFATGEYQTMH